MKASRRTTEYVIYFLFWGAMFLSPLWAYKLKSSGSVEWDDVFNFWLYLLPALILFFVNNNLLMPFLLYKKRGLHYLLYLVCIIVLVYFGFVFVASAMGRDEFGPHRREHKHFPPGSERAKPPHKKGPPKLVYIKLPETQYSLHDVFVDNEPYRVRVGPRAGEAGGVLRRALSHHESVLILLIAFTLIFNISVRLFFLALRDDDRIKELEKQKLHTELDYLKYQINPHFFMNTLNNINALIDIDKEKAQRALIELSRMMRHILYDASSLLVPLAKEVEFIESYVGLMRLRYTKALRVKCDLPTTEVNCFVPSLLFVPFVENAFKHGVSYNGKSNIEISVSVCDGCVMLSCVNDCVANAGAGKKDAYSGIGIDNVRKRLSLIYGDEYSLEIKRDKKRFSVTLKLPACYDKMYIG